MSNPVDDVRAKGLRDVVLTAVPLENYNERLDGVILVDLAVLKEGTRRVYQAYKPVKFTPLGYDDPVILEQQWARPDSLKTPGLMEIYSRYIAKFAKRRGVGGPKDFMTQE